MNEAIENSVVNEVIGEIVTSEVVELGNVVEETKSGVIGINPDNLFGVRIG